MTNAGDLYGLIFASLLPIVFSTIFYVLDKSTRFQYYSSLKKQIIIGISFGVLSILGSELGYSHLGAQLNCRDAAPVCAGLLFGPLAGVIAGLIGGIERWFAVYWGAGTFTRLACTLGTILAGVHAALLRKYVFGNRRPFWLLAIAVAALSEVLHLFLVVLTNTDSFRQAFDIIANVGVILIVFNSFSIGFASIIITLISRSKITFERKKQGRRITQIIQKWLIVAFFIAFVLSTWYIYTYQTALSRQESQNKIELSVKDVEGGIDDLTSHLLISYAHDITNEIEDNDLDWLLQWHGISEINIADKNGIIYKTSNPDFMGYDFHSGPQSREFLCIIEGDVEEYSQDYMPNTYYQQQEEKIVYMKYAAVAYKDGLLQVGYNANDFKALTDTTIIEFAKNNHIGRDGFVMITDNDGSIIYAPDEVINGTHEKVDLEKYATFSLQKCVINDKEYFYCYDKTISYTIVGLYPLDEALRTRDISIYINSFMELIIFACLYVMIYKFIDIAVVNKITEFQQELNDISNGQLDTALDIRLTKEYSDLSDDINKTVETLKKYIGEAEARIKTELDLANNIQKSSLPVVTPIISKRGDFDIAPFMATAKEVGGDFYDFYFTNRHILNFVIADVSGKGIPAALFMMRAKTELRSLSESGYEVNDVLEKGNAELCKGNDAGMFVTCWQGRINLETGVVQFANGGHNPPIVKRKNGETFFLKGKVNFVLGGIETSKYTLQEIQLEPGDLIYLYTDGVTEATNSSKQLYGENRLLNFIKEHNFSNMQKLCEDVKNDIDSFVNDAPQFDDISMIALKYNGILESTVKSTNLLKINNIKMNVECKDWKDAIKTASDLLARSGSVHESYYDDLIKTVDEHGPYIVLLPGFALAHTESRSAAVYKNDISLITLKNGVNFNSPNDPVRVVMAISCIDNDSQVNILQSIANQMIDDDIVDQVLNCNSEKEIIELFRKD